MGWLGLVVDYPKLSDGRCHRPYSPRVPAEVKEEGRDGRESLEMGLTREGDGDGDLERGREEGGEGVGLMDGVPQRSTGRT